MTSTALADRVVGPLLGPTPRVAVISDFPSADDAWKGVPFATTAAEELSRMAVHAKLVLSDLNRYHAMTRQPGGPFGGSMEPYWTKKKTIAKQYGLQGYLDGYFCTQEIVDYRKQLLERLRQDPSPVIVPTGNFSLWCLTKIDSVATHRGSILTSPELPGKLIIPTYAPFYIFRSYEDRPYCVRDWQRIGDVLADFQTYLSPPTLNLLTRPSFGQAMAVLRDLNSLVREKPIRLACDIETVARHISCVGIAWNKQDSLCIPTMGESGHYWTEREEFEIFSALRTLLTHPHVYGVGQNFNYDHQHFAKHHGYLPNIKFDTMIAQHVMFPGTPKNLGHLASLYCKHHVYWKDELEDYNKLPTDLEQYWRYNAKDCINTLEISEVQEGQLDELGFRKQFDFLFKLSLNVLRTMLRGMAINQRERGTVAGRLMEAQGYLEGVINQICGESLNTGSPAQMQRFFYESLGLPVQRDKRTKRPTTNEAALNKLVEIKPELAPLCDLIGRKRSLGVFLSTFCLMPLDTDRRMRCSFNVCGTETFRFSSSENAFGSGGNLQNIPKGEEND